MILRQGTFRKCTSGVYCGMRDDVVGSKSRNAHSLYVMSVTAGVGQE